MSCQACSSDIRESQPFTYPCCLSPICSTCLARNPRLREYTPCLRCGEVRTAEGSARVARGARERFEREVSREEVFVLEDEDDEEGGEGGVGGEGQGQGEAGQGEGTGAEEERAPPPAYEDAVGAGDGAVEEEQMETVEVKHTLSRGDTVLSVARKYAADPHHLLSLNNLPHTALSSNPGILRTRKHLVISRRLIPSSALLNPSLPDLGAAGEDDDDPARKREREVKRFQLLTKTPDAGVAGAYLAVAEAEVGGSSTASSSVSGKGVGQGAGVGFGGIQKEEWVGDLGSGEAMDGKKRPVDTEGRAVERWYEDEDWEREVGKPERRKEGKWKVVGSGFGMGVGVGLKG